MTVQELFKQVNKEDMFLSFIRRYDIIESYDHRGTVAQEVEIYKYFKKQLFDYVDRMSNCEIKNDKESIVFVIDTPACDFEDKKRREYEIFCLDKDEYLNKCNKDFHIWDEDTGIRIQHYSFSFSEINKVAGYEIAQKSVVEYGIEAVCAAIAHEMEAFSFGREEEKREDFFKSLDEQIEKAKNNETEFIPAEDVFAELKADLRSRCSDEENEYFDAEDEFYEKIKHLKDAWWTNEMNKKHQVLIDFIKENYRKSFELEKDDNLNR